MSKITIEFTPKDGSLSAVGTELTGADVIQRDLERLANKFDGGINWGDMSAEAWNRVDNEIEIARVTAISTAEKYVAEETAERASEDEITLTSAKTFATDADKTVLNSATEYTNTKINAEVTARDAAIADATSDLATKSSVADAISNTHTHSNKSVIDTITQAKIDKWDSGGTTDYTDLTNKPTINGVELTGDKTLRDLGGADFVIDKDFKTGIGANFIVLYDQYGATEVPTHRFANCAYLEEIHLTWTSTIRSGAFSCDFGVLRIVDIYSVKTIESRAFAYCSDIEWVTFRRVETIGDYAFWETGASKAKVVFDMTQVNTPPTLGTRALPNHEGLRIVVPKNDINTWKTAEGWSNYADYIFTSPYPR